MQSTAKAPKSIQENQIKNIAWILFCI